MDANILTKRQRQVLHTIVELKRQLGVWPSIRRIGAELGIRNPNGVSCHLRPLEKRGFISREKGESRNIRVLSHEQLCPCCKGTGVLTKEMAEEFRD